MLEGWLRIYFQIAVNNFVGMENLEGQTDLVDDAPDKVLMEKLLFAVKFTCEELKLAEISELIDEYQVLHVKKSLFILQNIVGL